MQRLNLFLIAVLALALMAFVSLDGVCPDANVRAEGAKPYPPLSPPSRGGSPEGALSFQHGGSAPCYALQNPTVRIDPAYSVVGVSDTFTVTVMIDQASNLGGFEFDLLFITTTVTVNGVTLGDFLGSTGRSVVVIPGCPEIDNNEGKVTFGAATFGSALGPNGTGALALITLAAQGEGHSPLDLQKVQVVGADARPQVVTDEDGTVWVGTPPTATSTPIATSTATVTATPTPTSTGAATPTPTATATGTPPTPTSTATATTAPEPMIVVYPTEAPLGETFTFTGSHFTPDGLIDAWFTAPSLPPAFVTEERFANLDETRYSLGSFYADSSGGFTYQHNWEKYWPAGIYSFIAIDDARESETSVEFEMTEPLPQTATSTPTITATATATPTTTPTATPYRLYLPLVLKE